MVQHVQPQCFKKVCVIAFYVPVYSVFCRSCPTYISMLERKLVNEYLLSSNIKETQKLIQSSKVTANVTNIKCLPAHLSANIYVLRWQVKHRKANNCGMCRSKPGLQQTVLFDNIIIIPWFLVFSYIHKCSNITYIPSPIDQIGLGTRFFSFPCRMLTSFLGQVFWASLSSLGTCVVPPANLIL